MGHARDGTAYVLAHVTFWGLPTADDDLWAKIKVASPALAPPERRVPPKSDAPPTVIKSRWMQNQSR